jgi:PAS domain S-box-containing protein
VARRSDKDLESPRSEISESDARDAIRAAQRIASQLHQLIAASLTVAGLRDEKDILESLAGSARRVFDADDAILSLENGVASPLLGVAQRSRLVTSFVSSDEAGIERPELRSGTSATWLDRDWLVAPIVEGRSEARGVIAVRRTGGEFQHEDREVLTLLAQMAATALSATEMTREVQSSEIRLRTLVDTAPAGIVEVDLEGTIQWWNRAAHQIFAWPSYSTELSSATAFPQSAMSELRALWDEVRQRSTPANRDLAEIEIQGRRRDLTASAVLLSSPDRGASILMLIDDVTDHRQLKAEVRHAQQMEIRGRVASSVAHDFNNLLTLISGYAEILVTGLADDDETTQMVKNIQSTATRASALTAQLQTIGRSESLVPTVFDPIGLLERSANVIERVVGESISIEWILDRNAGSVLVDPGQFEQMMLNLAINARDAMPQGGDLRISVTPVVIDAARATLGHVEPGRFVSIHVSDSGTGMSPETLAKCFDTFFTTKGPYKGTGMGLAAARRFVEESHGSIAVQSELGVGTEFEILLPWTAPEAVEPSSSPRERPDTATILLAEDDGDLRRLMTQVLRREGHTVSAVDSGEAAVEEARTVASPYDLLISDVVMGEMSGPELARSLQDQQPSLRVLLISGTADETITAGLNDGSSGFLAKPFRPTLFVDAVREILSR